MARPAFDASWNRWSELLHDAEADPVEILKASSRFQEYFSAIDQEAIRAALAAGATWSEIGDAVGRSRQAVWQRFEACREEMRTIKADPGAARRWLDRRTNRLLSVPPPIP